MIDSALEATLGKAYREAHKWRHEFVVVEHLLLALLENGVASEVLRACGADLEKLERQLREFLTEHCPSLADSESRETQPSLGFQRVLQRAVYHVQSTTGRPVVTGANVLVAIFSERESHALYFLEAQQVTRLDVISYLSHGIGRVATEEGADALEEEEAEGGGQGRPRSGPRRRPAESLYHGSQRAG